MRLAQRLRAAHETAFAVIRSDSPLAYWPMDESSGNFNDRSGNAHTLTPSGVSLAQTPPAGQFATAPHWNGTSAYASVALDLSALSAITITCWLSWDAFANDDKLLLEHSVNGNTRLNAFWVDPDCGSGTGVGKVQATMHGVSGAGAGTEYNSSNFTRPTAGVWHHWAFVYDLTAAAATKLVPYLDGAAASYTKDLSYACTGNFLNDTLYVGSRAGTGLFAAMYLRHLALFPTALSASRITAQFQAGRFG